MRSRSTRAPADRSAPAPSVVTDPSAAEPPITASTRRPPPFRRLTHDTGLALRALATWRARRWAAASVAGLLGALAVGLPTAVIPNPFFARMTPVEWWNVPVLALTALLGGVLVASYVRTDGRRAHPPDPDGTDEPTAEERADTSSARSGQRLGTVSGLLAYFAVGCPVCNKLVLLLLGTSGALNLWAPVQPLVAVLSLALLAFASVRRLAGEVACPAAP